MNIFNFLRGIALLCVIGIHTIGVVSHNYPAVKAPVLLHTPAWMSMWIFFFLSGYLLGKGFYKDKYRTDIGGICEFYLSRLIRIVPMYLFFLFIIFLFYNPMWFFEYPKATLRLLTFTYNGKPGIIGIGALWFVSTIVQLYIMTPFVYKFVLSKIKINNEKKAFVWLTVFTFCGLLVRFIIKWLKLPYYEYCFTLSVCNMDLFFGGMFLNTVTLYSKDTVIKKIFRPISLVLLFVLIGLYMYNCIGLSTYSRICPTLILILMSLIIYSYDCSGVKRAESSLCIGNVLRFPHRFIEYIGVISFTFYLYHSNIIEISMKIVKDKAFPLVVSDKYLYLSVFVLMFILSFVLSVVMNHILEQPCNVLRAHLKDKLKFLRKDCSSS